MANDKTAEWLALCAIANGKCRLAQGDSPQDVILTDAEGGLHRTDPAILRTLVREALVQRRGERLMLTVLGRALLPGREGAIPSRRRVRIWNSSKSRRRTAARPPW